jgi:hypothetical protein
MVIDVDERVLEARPFHPGSHHRAVSPGADEASAGGPVGSMRPLVANSPGVARVSVRIALLGDRLVTESHTGELRTRSARTVALIAYRAPHAGWTQPRQRSAGLFWPESTDPQSLTNRRRDLRAESLDGGSELREWLSRMRAAGLLTEIAAVDELWRR